MGNVRSVTGVLVAAAAMAAAMSCSGSSSSSSTGPSGSCTPSSNANTLVLQNNQVCPQALTVARGSQVTFINNDAIVHQIDSDPHPEHTDCPEINQVDFLNPGQSRQTGNLNVARRCGFHDHQNPGRTALQGTITIQ
jgi:plastocyanin